MTEIEPKSTSLDQASRQPHAQGLTPLQCNRPMIIKTLTKIRHPSKRKQKAIWNRMIGLGKARVTFARASVSILGTKTQQKCALILFILGKTHLSFGNGRRFGLDLKRFLTCCLIAVLAIAVAIPSYVLLKGKPANPRPSYCTFEVVNTFPHDGNAFTEGLVFEDGVLYESTGLNGYSTLRRVELQTGGILQLHSLPNQFFGEGITIFDNKTFQLTWLSHKGFVYNMTSFDLLGEFNYSSEGWGITNDGNRLIMSDGTANLYFLNPETLERVGQVEVRDNVGPVARLNELEYINGDVYANVWLQEKIAIINPQTGQVKTWIDLTGIQSMVNRSGDDVLNGIAYDTSENRLFITGKRWPQLFEIELVALH